MKRVIFTIRLGGYAAGLLGIGILLAARRLSLSPAARERWLGIGAVLLVVMFLCFLASYVFRIARILKKRKDSTTAGDNK